MMVTYDPEVDVLYVSFCDRRPGDVVRTGELGDGRQVDYAADGSVLGVEFLAVKQGLNLIDVPRADEVRAAIEALPRLPARAS